MISGVAAGTVSGTVVVVVGVAGPRSPLTANVAVHARSAATVNGWATRAMRTSAAATRGAGPMAGAAASVSPAIVGHDQRDGARHHAPATSSCITTSWSVRRRKPTDS